MSVMDAFKEQIIEGYVELRLSEKQIADKFLLSPKAVRKILDSKSVSRRSISEALRCLNITKFGKKEFSLKLELNGDDELLKVAGLMLYWGEGSKRGNTVAFSNSDPKMIGVFVRFLRVICGIHEERLHVTIHYYEDHDPEELRDFWSNVTQIPPRQFYKSILHRRRPTGSYRNPSRYGTISVQYSDSKLLALIISWMDACSNSFLRQSRAETTSS